MRHLTTDEQKAMQRGLRRSVRVVATGNPLVAFVDARIALLQKALEQQPKSVVLRSRLAEAKVVREQATRIARRTPQ
jgi:hypothetical protein